MGFGISPRLTTSQQTEVVLPCDPSVASAWTEEEQSEYMASLRRPDKPLPKDVTRFLIRPLGWQEKRRIQDEAPTWWYTQRGEELYHEQLAVLTERDALVSKRDSTEDADERSALESQIASMSTQAFRDGLSISDRKALREYNLYLDGVIMSTLRAAVVEVRQESHVFPIDEYLNLLDATAMVQLRMLIHAASRLPPHASKS